MMIRARLFAAMAAAAVLTASAGAAPVRGSATGTGWTSTWNSALAYAPAVGGWNDQTLRMVVRTSLGGDQLRLHLSNRFATVPAAVGHVTIGTQMNGGTTAEPTPLDVTFGGSTALTLDPGASAVSDPIALPVAPATRLLVSIYVPPGANMATSRHDLGGETNFNFSGGDVSGDQYYPTTNTFGFTALLDGLDVAAVAPSTVVAVGDSITDGVATMSNTDTRWPNYLAARAAAAGLAVIDQGIGGNWVTVDQGSAGQSLLHRWQRDVLDQPGARTVIDAEGINDLRGGVTAVALESAQASLVASAHAAGLRILLSTITPCAGDSKCGAAFEAERRAYNVWVISGACGADGVVDFDAAIASGASIKAVYDSGDHLHPNSAGAAAAANVVDVSRL